MAPDAHPDIAGFAYTDEALDLIPIKTNMHTYTRTDTCTHEYTHAMYPCAHKHVNASLSTLFFRRFSAIRHTHVAVSEDLGAA